MSRIGRLPIAIPQGVTVTVSDNVVTVKGPLGELKQDYKKSINVAVENNEVVVTRTSEDKEVKALHGLYRALISNMVEGVTKGFSKSLTVKGVGYKVAKQGKKLVMNIGYSHPVEIEEPDGITFECPSITEIVVKGIDKDAVGQIAATIKAARKVEPYHGYGIRYTSEFVQLKEGKKAGK